MHALLINPSADFSFWTLPESLRFTGSKALAPPLGLITVAALLPSNWELRLVDLNARKLTAADWEWAEVILISGMLSQRTSFLEIVKEAKHRGKPVVAGGPYPTSLPGEMKEVGVDYLVRGEAEGVMPQFLEAFTQGRKGVFQGTEKPDMSLSPVPRYDLLNMYDYQMVLVQTSRGCPFECEFCDIVNLFGRRPRYKSPQQVLAELDNLHRLGWRGTVFIADDNFIGSRKHARAILQELIPWNMAREQPFGFLTQASVNLGQDVELIDLLTAANFGNIFIGIESPDKSVLEEYGKHQNVTYPLIDSIRTINKNGLIVLGSFIVGFDGEREGTDRRIAQLVEHTSIPIVMINILNALPGTKLWNRLEREGRLADSMSYGQCMAGDRLNFIPSRSESQIYEEFVKTWDYLYDPPRFMARTARYFLTMRPTRRAQGMKQETPKLVAKNSGPPWRIRFRYFRGFLRLLWEAGIHSPHRRHFWRHLLEVWRKNSSRLTSYVHTIGLGENMLRIREFLLAQGQKETRETSDFFAPAIQRKEAIGGPTIAPGGKEFKAVDVAR